MTTILKVAAATALYLAIFLTIAVVFQLEPASLASFGASALATYAALVIVWGRKAVHSLFA